MTQQINFHTCTWWRKHSELPKLFVVNQTIMSWEMPKLCASLMGLTIFWYVTCRVCAHRVLTVWLRTAGWLGMMIGKGVEGSNRGLLQATIPGATGGNLRETSLKIISVPDTSQTRIRSKEQSSLAWRHTVYLKLTTLWRNLPFPSSGIV
jgi:hypothetical protein